MGEILAAGFEEPSAIQKFMWPVLSKGRDAVGIAVETGKTLGLLSYLHRG